MTALKRHRPLPDATPRLRLTTDPYTAALAIRQLAEVNCQRCRAAIIVAMSAPRLCAVCRQRKDVVTKLKHVATTPTVTADPTDDEDPFAGIRDNDANE